MVEHQGEVALRGEALYHRKDTCTAASAHAEVSYLSPTFLRCYSSEVHPPTPIGTCSGLRPVPPIRGDSAAAA
eukprot:6443861-Pyramimonas_sp.AAC.1